MTTARPADSAPSVLGRMAGAVMRIVIALLGFVMVASALMLGILMAFGLLVWSLLRGRRPAPMDLRWQTVRRPGAFRRAAGGEVVDVQAREVPEPVEPPTR